MRFWKLMLMALGGLRRTPLRATLTTLGVAIASAALVSMVAFTLGLQRQIEAPMKLLSLLNDIHVFPKSGVQAKDARVLDDAALDQLAHLPDVSAAFPNIRVQGIRVRHGDKVESCLAMGMPREATLWGVADEILLAGRFFTESRRPEAILGAQLAHSLGFAAPRDAVGATLKLEAGGLLPGLDQSFTFHRKDMLVDVVGVYDIPLMVATPARNGIILPVDLMKEVPGIQLESALSRLKAGIAAPDPGYSSATVRVGDAAHVAAVEEKIKSLGFQTSAMLKHFQEMRTFFLFLRVLLTAVGSVALVVAALGIVNTLVMSVLERYQEIGIYKAVGASDGDLLALFLAEAGAIGLWGGLGGLVLGRLVSYGLELAINAYARGQGATEPLTVFAFPPWLLAGTVLFAVAVSILAGVYPALRAARVDPISALRRG